MIKEDLYNELLNSSPVAAIVGTRIFWNPPMEAQTESYLTYRLDPAEEYNDVRNRANMRIICFCKDQLELDELAETVKTALDGKKSLNSNQYYKVFVFSKVDGNEKLRNGFYYSIIRVEICYTP